MRRIITIAKMGDADGGPGMLPSSATSSVTASVFRCCSGSGVIAVSRIREGNAHDELEFHSSNEAYRSCRMRVEGYCLGGAK